MRTLTESQLQALVLELAVQAGFLAFHDHDSRRNARGLPDLILLHRRTGRLVFVELKSATGRVRPEQQVWLEALRIRHEAYLWRPVDWFSGEIPRILLGQRVAATVGAASVTMRA
jgi:hypothetical protein